MFIVKYMDDGFPVVQTVELEKMIDIIKKHGISRDIAVRYREPK